MNIRILILIFNIFGAISCSSSVLPDKENLNQKRVLFIGHSYTAYNDLPGVFQQLTIDSGEDTVFYAGNMGRSGYGLWFHEHTGEAEAILLSNEWDYVVLQGINFAEPEKYLYAMYFDSLSKSIDAKTIFFLRWTHEGESDYQIEYNAAFKEIAELLNSEVVPVGPAWQNVLKENPNIGLYLPDKSHPTELGTYLAACTFYSYFYNKSPEGLPYGFNTSAEQEEIDLIQRVVWETIQNYDK